MFQWLLQSSVDPNKLALTVKGVILGFVPVAILIAKSFGLELQQEDLENLAVIVSTGLSIVVTLYGLVRKILVSLKK